MSGQRELIAQVEDTKQRLEAANARVNARAGRNLFWAIVTGVIMGAAFVAALVVGNPLLPLTALLVAFAALYELVNAFRAAGRRVPRVGVQLGSILIISLCWWYQVEGLLFGLYAAAGLLIIWRIVEGLNPRSSVPLRIMTADLAAGVFCLVYVPFLLSLALLLARIPTGGSWWLFTLVLLAVCNDTGAYVTGLLFGKRKLSPRISPNKTWEGFLGAAVCVLVAAVLAGVFLLTIPWWAGLILGACTLLTATGGDLVESLLKRNLGVKDMSGLIPGHGGLLDRLDSILPSTIPFFILASVLGVL